MPKHAPSVYVPLDAPPVRSAEPIPHLSAGRHLFAQRYVVGWPQHGLVKIGCSSSHQRVRRFLRTQGAELIDLAYYEHLFDDVRSETWLSTAALTEWPRAWENKDHARFLMGSDTAGWTEFLAVPVADWPTLRRLAAL